MPKIKSFAPSWLNAPAPGHKLFAPSEEEAPLTHGKKPRLGRRQTMARRGTEVFAASGKQIRWGDLAYFQESWESNQAQASGASRDKREDSDSSFEVYCEEDAQNAAFAEGYRTFKTPVVDEICQLLMSPQQDFLAVLTKHTVHICVLPDASQLTAKDTTPFKPKFWTLGPTTHVTTRSAVVSAIWHPLGVNGCSIVTVTEDSIVRLWELSTSDRWSFDMPTLAVDLRRLADGVFIEQDFTASTSATNQGFSPDSIDMDVAAACFPDRGTGGWSPMTLWVAMTSGDVYALCPLLPSRWAPPPTLVPSLSVSMVAKTAATMDDPDASAQEKMLAQQQLQWMADLDSQEPRLVEGLYGEPTEVYLRPSRPGTIPRLQGPFKLEAKPDDEAGDESDLRDIHVIGEKINMTDLVGDKVEDVGDFEQEGLSLSVICLLSKTGQVKICLDVGGVEAQWLPPRGKIKPRRLTVEPEQPALLVFQTLDTLKPAEYRDDAWPTFSEDITSRYSFFITHPAGITQISLAPWVFRLESELRSDLGAGSEFRMHLLTKGPGSDRERIFTQRPEQGVLAAAVAIRDPDLGYFLLSATHQGPLALFFELPEEKLATLEPAWSTAPGSGAHQGRLLDMWEPRPLFRANESLQKKTEIFAWHTQLGSGKRRPLLSQSVCLSPATLEIFTNAHRIVSSEVFHLNGAVAELFRKCESLHGELREQVVKANEVKQRIETITGDESAAGTCLSDNTSVRQRTAEAKIRQASLAHRMEDVRKKLGRRRARELSDKEKAWMDEVKSLEQTVLGGSGAGQVVTPTAKPVKQAWQRVQEVGSLRKALISQAEQILGKKAKAIVGRRGSGSQAATLTIPVELRKQKLAQVMGLLDRESALVEAVKSRLERLAVG